MSAASAGRRIWRGLPSISMCMAVVWSGHLTFGLVTLPARLYSGARGERIGFHLLHARDRVRLKQQMICPADGQVAPRAETVRGYEYAKGEYVVLSDEEIRNAAPPTRQQMEIFEFCRSEEIDPLWFESSYYLMPEPAGRRAYQLLARAMQESGYFAVAKISMHNRESIAVLRSSHLAGVPRNSGTPALHRAGLLLHTLFYADEIRVAEGFGEPAAEAPSAAELRLAQELISALAHPFEADKFQDTYRKNLEAAIAAKLEGRAAAPAAAPRPFAPVADLMASLKRSLERVPTAGASRRKASVAGESRPRRRTDKHPRRAA